MTDDLAELLRSADVGHRARVDRIRHAIDAHPGLHLGGAAMDGLGIAARAKDAQRLADAVVGRAELTARTGRG